MTDGTAEQLHPRKYSAGRNDILDLQGDRRISIVAGHPHRSHPTGVWVLPEYPQDEQEEVQRFVSHQTVAGELQENDDILFRSLVIPKYSFQHRKRYTRRRMALLKLSLMAFSFVFWIAGLAMLIVGIWAKISLEQYLALSTNSYPNTPLILLVSGAAVLLWGFLGCFSAAVEKRCLLRTYGLFQLAVLLAGLAAGLSGLF